MITCLIILVKNMFQLKQKFNVLFLFCFLFILGCDNSKVEPIDTNIDNKISEEHINFPGTHIYVIPPDDFEKADNFNGFIKGELAIINFNEFVNVNYLEKEKLILDSAIKFDKRIAEYSKIRINGYNGLYYKLVDLRNYVHQSVVFGDSTFMVTINSVAKKSDLLSQNQITETINSIAFKYEKTVNAIDGLRFTLDDNKSRFKFNSINANMCYYLLDTIYSNDTIETYQVIAEQLPISEETFPRTPLFTILDLMKEEGAVFSKGRVYTSNNVNGYLGYQLETTMSFNGENYNIYICSVKYKNVAVVIYGFVPYEQPQLIREIKNLAGSIKIE